jgi:hypothetical protein
MFTSDASKLPGVSTGAVKIVSDYSNPQDIPAAGSVLAEGVSVSSGSELTTLTSNPV